MKAKNICAHLLAVLLVLLSVYAVAEESDQPHIHWSVEKVKSVANNIRAGSNLKPSIWKHQNKVAVLISIDVDNELLSFSQSQSKHGIPEGRMSFAEYGANEGLPRIVRLLKKENIPTTFFIPALMLEIHPETITEIQKLDDYEVGVHGWIHEYNAALSSLAVEKNLIEKSVKLISKKFGKRPQGYRAPSWNYSPYTLEVIRALGFIYDSSLMARDDPYEICKRQPSGVSEATGVVELPVSWILDDYPLLSMSTASYSPPREVLQVYKDEFDQAYKEGGLFNLALHPHVIGRRSRILILEELIQHIKSYEGVWFATHIEVAEYIQQETLSLYSKCP